MRVVLTISVLLAIFGCNVSADYARWGGCPKGLQSSWSCYLQKADRDKECPKKPWRHYFQVRYDGNADWAALRLVAGALALVADNPDMCCFCCARSERDKPDMQRLKQSALRTESNWYFIQLLGMKESGSLEMYNSASGF